MITDSSRHISNTHQQLSLPWSKWALKTLISKNIIPLHSIHIRRSLLTLERIVLTIDEDYVQKKINKFNVMEFYQAMFKKGFQPNTPGLTSVIGAIRLLSCSGVIELLENGVSFDEKTAKSISIITIKYPNNYHIRTIPIQVTCINTFCMFAVEHPERLLPKFHSNVDFDVLLPFCASESVEVDTISASTIFIKVVCKLCTKLMSNGYSVGLSVRCKDSTSRYGMKFQTALSKCALECGTQLKIHATKSIKETPREENQYVRKTIVPISPRSTSG